MFTLWEGQGFVHRFLLSTKHQSTAWMQPFQTYLMALHRLRRPPPLSQKLFENHAQQIPPEFACKA